MVIDITTGKRIHSHDAVRPNGDAIARWRHRERMLAEQNDRKFKPTWISRLIIALRIVETDPEDIKSGQKTRHVNSPYTHQDDNLFDRFLVWLYSLPARWKHESSREDAQELNRTRTNIDPHHVNADNGPVIVDGIIASIRQPKRIGGPQMAEEINSFDDLYDPHIDVPLEYPERVPAQLSGASRLLDQYASDFEEMAAEESKKAEAIRRFRDYHATAKVARPVLADLDEAADMADEVAEKMKQVAALYGEIATSLASAARSAEAEYSDHVPPRYDQANGDA